MPRYLVTHNDLACLWSTVVDAPVSNFESYDKLKAEHPTLKEYDLAEFVGETSNRAGPDESSVLTIEEMLKLYEDDEYG